VAFSHKRSGLQLKKRMHVRRDQSIGGRGAYGSRSDTGAAAVATAGGEAL
jgi:hypothetical protein